MKQGFYDVLENKYCKQEADEPLKNEFLKDYYLERT